MNCDELTLALCDLWTPVELDREEMFLVEFEAIPKSTFLGKEAVGLYARSSKLPRSWVYFLS